MKGTHQPLETSRRRLPPPLVGKKVQTMRRTNRLAHVITHHGHLLLGRKGRAGVKGVRH